MKSTNIRQRPDGMWEARLMVNGKRKSVYAKTKKEVKEKLVKMMQDANDGLMIDESSMTVMKWMEEYIASYMSDVKPATMAAYVNDINRHIIPALGKIKLKDLSPIQVQRFYKDLITSGLSPKTVRDIHGVLHGALDKAIRMDMIKRNVSELCDLPKNRKKEMHPLSDVQVQDFLQRARDGDPDFYPVFFIAFFTGMRQCQIVGLTWDCIDFNNGTIHIYRQYSCIEYGQRKGQYDFAPLKNDKERTFRVATSVMTMLRKVKLSQVIINRKGFVFTRSDGRPISASTMYHHFKRIVTDMGLPQVRFHDARHTFATLSIQNGVDIKTLSLALGHATASFTLDVYGHVTELMQHDMADKMQRFIVSL